DRCTSGGSAHPRADARRAHVRGASSDMIQMPPLCSRPTENCMSYLYGDSTPSALETNYIEFLRDAVDFCVQVLLADQRGAEARARTAALDRSSAAEIDRLQQLTATVATAMAGLPPGAPESSAPGCAA